MKNISITPIGIIHTPHTTTANMPIQPIGAKGVKGRIELCSEYREGLKDIEGFSHITLIYHFHTVTSTALRVTPFMDTEERGVFSCRAPKRPNRIGISTVKLIRIEDTTLYIEEADMLDGTPLIDIKPFYAEFDNRDNTRAGWLEKCNTSSRKTLISDDRFAPET